MHLSDSSNYNHSSFLSRKWLLITDTQTLWSRPCNDIGVCCPWTGQSFPLPSNLISSQWSSFKQQRSWKIKSDFFRKWLLLTDTQTLWSRPCNDIGVCYPWTDLCAIPLTKQPQRFTVVKFQTKGVLKVTSPGNDCSLLTNKLWLRPCNECGFCCLNGIVILLTMQAQKFTVVRMKTKWAT